MAGASVRLTIPGNEILNGLEIFLFSVPPVLLSRYCSFLVDAGRTFGLGSRGSYGMSLIVTGCIV